MFEGAAIPGVEFVTKPAVGVLQEFIAGAPEVKVAVPRVVKLVAIAHDEDRLAYRTRVSGRLADRDAASLYMFEDTAASLPEVTEFGGCRT